MDTLDTHTHVTNHSEQLNESGNDRARTALQVIRFEFIAFSNDTSNGTGLYISLKIHEQSSAGFFPLLFVPCFVCCLVVLRISNSLQPRVLVSTQLRSAFLYFSFPLVLFLFFFSSLSFFRTLVHACCSMETHRLSINSFQFRCNCEDID